MIRDGNSPGALPGGLRQPVARAGRSLLLQIPGRQMPDCPLEHRSETEEGTVDVTLRDVGRSECWRGYRRQNGGGFAARGGTLPPQPAGLAEDTPDAGGTGGDQIGGHHHFGEAPVSDRGVQRLEIEDPLLFALFEPKIPGDVAVVLVLGAVALAPVVELADGEAGDGEECFDGAVGPFGPMVDEVDDLVARFGLDPAPVERAPNSFLESDVLGEEFGDELVFLAERGFQFVDAFLCFVACGSFLVLVGSGLGDQRRAAVGEELLLPGV